MIIIDGNSLLNRAFYALPPLKTKDGRHTNAIYGFLTMTFRMLEEHDPSYLAVAFDLKKPTFRHKEYKDYKAGRKKMPPELRQQIEPLKDILDALNVYRIEIEGFEADDIIGTVVTQGEEQGIETLVVTGDKDALQLASQTTKIVFTKRGISNIEIYDADKVKEETGVSPKTFIDLKGLMGDSSDNIPGIPGVGEKTALKLLQEFGSVENLIANMDQISGEKLREKVEKNQEKAVLSKRLATIVRTMPMDIDFSKLKRRKIHREEAVAAFKDYEFHSLMKKIREDEDSAGEEDGIKALKEVSNTSRDLWVLQVKEDKNFKQLQKGINEYLKTSKELGIFSFTKGEALTKDDILALSMVTKENKLYVIDLQALDSELKEAFWQWFRDLTNKEDVGFVAHNMKKEILHLKNHSINLNYVVFDTMIAEYLINPNKSGYDLEDLVLEYTGANIKSKETFLGKGKKQVSFTDLEESEFVSYLTDRVQYLFSLKELMEEKIEEYDLKELQETVEVPLIEVLAGMEYQGILADRELLLELQEKYEEKIDKLTKTIYNLAGESFNINSPKQLGNILFDKLDLPPIKKTKTGYSTNVEVLEKLKDKHEIIEKILEYRQITKLKNTYIDGLLKIINPSTKRIHSHFMQTVASTGRISSTEPNLQNIPIRLEMGRQLRKVFVAKEGASFIAADYSQIELRVLAHMSGDENLINAFLRDEDIHTRTAAEIFDVDFNEVTSQMRSNAKAVNFGIVYGISDYGLSENLGISRKKAQKYIDNYFKKYPKVKSYMDSTVAFAKEKGYVTTLLNRRRYLPDIHARNFNLRSFAERTAMNTPIQGSAADIIKIAMIQVYKKLEEQNMEANLLLQVHDELIVEAPEKEVDQVKEIIRSSMEEAMELKVHLKIDMSQGKSWYDLK
ncbi:DNA polymerase I [Isachenkonia alkalipeptolytica]|uniref:DNA polymerase I n=1 Tax=Isachenkonia alkalipeptolytica TaxID=2565777 RepID=A0AA43XJH4_9CLOT|nr:DNA polymerase I [Isachenkonia alkalipeptolytica]